MRFCACIQFIRNGLVNARSHSASAGLGLKLTSTRPSCAKNGRTDQEGTGYVLRSRSVNEIWVTATSDARSASSICRLIQSACCWGDDVTPVTDPDDHPP